MTRQWQSAYRLPTAVSGLGLLFLGILNAELLAAILYPIRLPDAYLIGVVSSLVFISGLTYGGYWLSNSGLSTARYRRIGLWSLSGGLMITPLVVWLAVASLPETAISVHFVAGVVRWAGSIGCAVGLSLGIFEAEAIERREIVEQLEQRTDDLKRERDRLEQFADIVSHDLRNPLHVIDGRLALARREHDSEHLEEIAAAHDRMIAIVDDTLTLARQGKTVDTTEQVDLEQLCKQAWGVVETDGATLEIEAALEVTADGERLRHVFENLFRNSVEHGSTESDDASELTVRVGPLATQSGFYIEDTGSGISEADRSMVFNSGYSTSTEGTGLGLAIVEEIITAHGWQVAVDERPDGGARFEITGVDSLQLKQQPQPKEATPND